MVRRYPYLISPFKIKELLRTATAVFGLVSGRPWFLSLVGVNESFAESKRRSVTAPSDTG
jgi:hypothetical protein